MDNELVLMNFFVSCGHQHAMPKVPVRNIFHLSVLE